MQTDGENIDRSRTQCSRAACKVSLALKKVGRNRTILSSENGYHQLVWKSHLGNNHSDEIAVFFYMGNGGRLYCRGLKGPSEASQQVLIELFSHPIFCFSLNVVLNFNDNLM